MTDIVGSISNTVIFLMVGKPSAPIGTAFLVAYPHPTIENAAIPLVVTAKHVLADHPHVSARFSTQESKSTATVEYDLNKLKASGDYWEHPDPGVDIAVFRSLHFNQTKYETVLREIIATKETFKTEQIRQTDRIIFPSLLVNFMGLRRNYPVMRDGSVALVPDEQIPMKYTVGSRLIETTQEVILVDATSIPGASGSPVFLWPGPRLRENTFVLGGTRPYLLGVMHGFYPALPRDLIETSHARTRFAENSGIAIVFPSWRILEILDSEATQTRLKAIFDAPPDP
jgi:hypothetical protein